MKNTKSVVLIVIVTLVALSAGYIVASKVWGFPIFGAPSDGNNQKAETDKTVMYNLGQFITNLVDPGKYIRVTIEIEMLDTPQSQDLISNISEIKTDIYALIKIQNIRRTAWRVGIKRPTGRHTERIDLKCTLAWLGTCISEFIIQ